MKRVYRNLRRNWRIARLFVEQWQAVVNAP